MKSVLAIDQGTTGSTGLVIGENGQVLGRAYSEFTQHFPEPGWVEHDASEIWTVTWLSRSAGLRIASAKPLRPPSSRFTNWDTGKTRAIAAKPRRNQRARTRLCMTTAVRAMIAGPMSILPLEPVPRPRKIIMAVLAIKSTREHRADVLLPRDFTAKIATRKRLDLEHGAGCTQHLNRTIEVNESFVFEVRCLCLVTGIDERCLTMSIRDKLGHAGRVSLNGQRPRLQ